MSALPVWLLWTLGIVGGVIALIVLFVVLRLAWFGLQMLRMFMNR